MHNARVVVKTQAKLIYGYLWKYMRRDGNINTSLCQITIQ